MMQRSIRTQNMPAKNHFIRRGTRGCTFCFKTERCPEAGSPKGRRAAGQRPACGVSMPCAECACVLNACVRTSKQTPACEVCACEAGDACGLACSVCGACDARPCLQRSCGAMGSQDKATADGAKSEGQSVGHKHAMRSLQSSVDPETLPTVDPRAYG